MTITIALLQNAALVVLLAILQRGIRGTRPGRWLGSPVLSGVLYGLTGLIAMTGALELSSGYRFDGRSVVLTIAGTFGGPVSAAVAAVICSAYRIALGGIGTSAGVFSIVISALLGSAVFELRQRGIPVMRPISLWTVGLLVHGLILWGQVFLLGETGVAAVSRLGIPIMLLFPITYLAAALLVLDEERVRELKDHLEEQTRSLSHSVDALIAVVGQIVETRDPCTAGHERRVAMLAVAIAYEMGVSGDELRDLETAAMIHDVGKVAVPAEVLAKPGRLTTLERRVVRQHVETGHRIVSTADLGERVAELVYQHHERLDGTGYPRGLAGPELLRGSRILMVADVVEAMCSHRPYRAACGVQEALAELRNGAGTLYDRLVCETCIELFESDRFSFE